MTDWFEDERGYIRDLTAGVDAVTEILTHAGHVRGNHVHKATTHWTYIVSGRLQIRNGGETVFAGPGDLVEAAAGVEHAWLALEDSITLEFKRGPGSGEAYEDDVVRLEVPLL